MNQFAILYADRFTKIAASHVAPIWLPRRSFVATDSHRRGQAYEAPRTQNF